MILWSGSFRKSERNARLSGSLFTTNTAGLGIDFVRMTDKSICLITRNRAIWGRRKEISIMNTVPMTPTRRMEIKAAIDNNIAELRTCEPNALVNMQIAAWETHRKLINALPDGYPLPLAD